MLKILVLSALCASALADIDATVTRYASQVNFDGSYAYDVAQSNGAEQQESGVGGQYAHGVYQYYSPEGQLVQVVYTADENGFQPQSDVLPTPPPVPDYIVRAIDYIRDHPTAEELADQQVRAAQF